jgi:hypothetical protein
MCKLNLVLFLMFSTAISSYVTFLLFNSSLLICSPSDPALLCNFFHHCSFAALQILLFQGTLELNHGLTIVQTVRCSNHSARSHQIG